MKCNQCLILDRSPTITEEDKIYALKRATGHFEHYAGEKIQNGMTDDEIEEMLKFAMSQGGGSYGPEKLCVAWRRSGLKIWASWGFIVTGYCGNQNLILRGKQTIRMARLVYDIPYPGQLRLSFLNIKQTERTP